MNRITIAGQSYEFERAELVAYHCASGVADWNLELVREGTSLWLAGEVEPGPSTITDLEGAVMRLDPRSLDEVAGQLVERMVTLYPRREAALEFRPVCAASGVQFTLELDADWDPALGSFAAPGVVSVQIVIEAEVAGLHPGQLPESSA